MSQDSAPELVRLLIGLLPSSALEQEDKSLKIPHAALLDSNHSGLEQARRAVAVRDEVGIIMLAATPSEALLKIPLVTTATRATDAMFEAVIAASPLEKLLPNSREGIETFRSLVRAGCPLARLQHLFELTGRNVGLFRPVSIDQESLP